MRYFVAVAEELNFGRAAARLHVAQPGLSQQIKALEAELGVRLFDRTRRRVTLTEPGSMLLAEAYAVLGRFDQCLETMRQVRGRSARTAIRIGMYSEFSRMRGPALVAEVRRRHPELLLAVEAAVSASAVRAVEVGELELAIVRSIPEGSPVARRLLDSEPLGACLPQGHPLARRRGVRPDQLSGEQLMWMPRRANPELYDEVLSTLSAAGFEWQSVESAGTTSASFALVAETLGWSLACESDVSAAAGQLPLTWVRLTGVELIANNWVIWAPTENNPLVAQVIEVLAEILPSERRASVLRSGASQ